MKKAFKFLFVLSGCISCLLISEEALADGYMYDGQIYAADGITVEGTSVAGMTREQLDGVAKQYLSNASGYELSLGIAESENKAVHKTAGLKLSLSNAEVLDEALIYGNRGNAFQKSMERANIKNNGISYDIKLSADEESVSKLVEESVSKLNVEAKDGSIRRENGSFVIEPGVIGYEVDSSAAVSAILEHVNGSWDKESDISLTLDAKETVPRGTYEELSKVKDLIGTASTYYTGSYNRGMNLANGTRKISGSVVYPGEVFSVYDAVNPFTKENGYFLAGSYENGTVVETYGGGICQVSSTLYNAVLAAELSVVERSAHSMIVSYLEPSKDAAIAGTYKDLKFRNDGEYPIYIEGSAGGGKLSFSIYGHESRSEGRKVKYVSEVLTTNDPGIKYVEVDKPIGYQKVVQSAHVGHTARLIKVVTENGSETREVVNNSTYRASPKIIEIGVKSDVEGAADAIRDAIKSKDKDKVDAAIEELKNAKKQETPTEDENDGVITDGTTGEEDLDWSDGSE